MRLSALALALTLVASLPAQTFLEPFDAGFTSALGWAGDLDAFAGEEGRLVLRDRRAAPSNTARVWAPAPTEAAACWQLDVRQAFSASPSNRLRWWLAADRPLDEPGVAGFYLQVGGVSGDADALELVYESGDGPTAVAAGSAGFAAADPLAVAVEVCGTADRRWRLTARDRAGAPLDSASGEAPVALRGAYVGLDVRFTATRQGLLSVDDLLVDPIVVDTVAPRVVLATAPSATSVLLVASEALDAEAADATNYRVGRAGVTDVGLRGDSVQLQLSSALPEGLPVTVEIAAWTDLAGNAANDLMTEVTYVAPRQLGRYDLLLSEIMADPTPAVGLPAVEYVEVFNASDRSVRLSDVSIDGGGAPAILPDTALLPGAFIALAGGPSADPRLVHFEALPTLPNSGATLRLREGARVIDEVAYEDGYHGTGKRDGGYSLERRDLTRPCLLGAANWASSRALSGGTPGAANSVTEPLPVTPLRLTGAEVVAGDTVVVRTNRGLAGALSDAFSLDGASVVGVVERGLGRYGIGLTSPLRPGRRLRLALSDAATSCVAGEAVDTSSLLVGVPEVSAPGDWVLSELMYDPLAGQGRWVELYNRSDKLLSLGGLLLAEADASGEVIEAFAPARDGLVGPGGYLVLAADPASLLAQYPEAIESAVIEARVPTLEGDGCLLLADAVAEERHFLVCHRASWHNRAYAKTDGVSLERIDLEAPAEEASNWTSAASTVGFATPTRRNSQARIEGPRSDATLALQRERFSPDGDGFEDLLAVDYAFETPGTLVTFEVVDLQGRALYRPPEQEAVARRGVWTWDGVTDEGAVVAVGTYVLRVESWSADRVAERVYLPFSVVGY